MTVNKIETRKIEELRSMGLTGREIVEYFIESNNFIEDEKIMAIAVIKAFRMAKKVRKHITLHF